MIIRFTRPCIVHVLYNMSVVFVCVYSTVAHVCVLYITCICMCTLVTYIHDIHVYCSTRVCVLHAHVRCIVCIHVLT